MKRDIYAQSALRFLKASTTCLILCFLSAQSLWAQTIDFHTISLEEGLAQSVVTSIEQDDKGFLWLATQSGLNKYNGKSFSLFKHDSDDSTSISNNWVTTLQNVPGKPFLWVGTSSGLNKFDLTKETFKRYFHSEKNPHTLSNNRINSLYRDQDGVLWVGTQEGLNRFDPQTDQFKRITPKNDRWDPEHFNITSLSGLGNEIWLASSAGLLIYNVENKTFTKPQQKPFSETILTLYHDTASSTIWAGSSNGTLLSINEKHNISQQFSAQDGILNAPVQSINKDKDDNLWVGTADGLTIFDPSKKVTLHTIKSSPQKNHGLSESDIRCIFIDQSSVVWVSTYGGGVSKTNTLNEQFQHFKMNPSSSAGLNSNQIRTITGDKDGNIWIGTTDIGIEKFNPDNNTFSHYPHDSSKSFSPSSNYIRRMYVDSNNNLWVAANGVGIDRFDLNTGSKITITPKDGLANKNIWPIAEDEQGYLWFGSYGGGVNRYNPETGSMKTLTHNAKANSLSSNFVTAIYPQSPDSIWFGTQDGLNIYNVKTGKFTIFKANSNDSTSLSKGLILDIHKGPTGDIWIATFGGGVDRFDVQKETFKHYQEKDGLAHNSTYNFLEDQEGNIWVSTNNGLSRINPFTDQIRNYSTSHGLQSKEFNNGAYHKTDEGIMYFGGINGFNRFNPAEISKPENGPEVAITKFALFNNEVPIGKMENGRTVLDKAISHTSQLNLSYKDYVFSFEFAALDYAYPKQNKFAYKMEGLENKWNQVGNRNYVSYTNMPAGEYTFKVKAADYNGVWSENPATIKLNVAPPFWQTTWFYILSSLLILASVFGIYRYRVRSIRESNKRLTRKVDERTQELNEKNNDLQDTLKELEETKDELVDKAHKAGMADIATGVLHNVGNILNSVNTSSSIMEQTIRNSKVEGLKKANALLRKNMDHIEEFIAEDPKGKKLLSYYLKIEDLMVEEQQTMLKHNFRLNEKIHLINDVISTQQNYAGAERYVETVSLPELVESALTLQSGSIDRHDINVEKNLDKSVPKVEGQKTKIIHILVNLFKNAKEAIAEAGIDKEPKVIVDLCQDESAVYLSITDNGCGITTDKLNKVFNHGFTTKKEGHGFGLHSCSNYMTEMDGQLTVDSDGLNQGATFTLVFPKPSKTEATPAEYAKNGSE